MNQGFWGKLNKPFTVLAPMANVTDWAFRQIIKECGAPDVFYTEFVSADGILAAGAEKFKGELFFEQNEQPIVAQFFSANPENIRKVAEMAVSMGFNGIDINMGCPDRSVEKQGAGAAMMKNPILAKTIIKAAVKGAGKIPVSVKTRLGYNKIEINNWIDQLLDTEISALTVHARTRKEMSLVPAHWEEMGGIAEKAKNAGKIIIGNGDVSSIKEVNEKTRIYGLDGIMIGRGIFANPWLFNPEQKERTPEEKIKLLLKHLGNFEKLWGDKKNYDSLKRFFKIYINNWPDAKDLRNKLMMTKNIQEARTILK